ncbi:MAG: cysteine desulfurase NifS [Candidatus Cloacimonadota bacterium]|nr:MAG: cysteine desulfurase NifS [Candidatus Cloacimonadota bacterium]PIE77963.1 MAG: cysteine desulfurase NifS [Candidatus Delongbacteria bacterium]
MSEDKIIYFDNGDTTRIDDSVLEYMLDFYKKSYGNPISLHSLGMEADEAVNEAREGIASYINSNKNELVFTSGATESNNLAITGVAKFYGDKGKHIIISATEHSSVREVAKRLEKNGYEVTEISVDREGFLDLEELKRSIRKDTILVSVIYANYEIGTIQDISAIGKICRDNGIIFHSDAAQAFGKLKIDVVKENIDLLTFNAHKMHGPKGVGALYVRKGINLTKMFDGGAHEMGIRPGTENVPAIMGFYKASEIAYANLEEDTKKIVKLRDLLAEKLLDIDHVFYNGPKGKNLSRRLSNNVDFTFQYIEGEAILMHLTLRGICVSSGSACSSKTLEPSHILTSIGLKHEQAHGSIRFTISKYTTEEEVLKVAESMKEIVDILRSMSSFKPEEHSELVNENAKTFYKKR